MGQNPSGPCLKEKVHGGTNLLDEKLFLHMKHVTVSETHIKRLYAYCCSFLGKNSLAFCSCPTLTTLDKTENLTAPFCSMLVAYWPAHKATEVLLITNQALNISKAQLFPVWITWCFTSADWTSHYSCTGLGNCGAVKCQPPALLPNGEKRREKVRSWEEGRHHKTSPASFIILWRMALHTEKNHLPQVAHRPKYFKFIEPIIITFMYKKINVSLKTA